MSRYPFILALSTLIGTIIGGGIFAVPYVVAHAGTLLTLGYVVVLGALVTLVHLLFGEVVLRTHGKHRLIGYAGIYLGPWGRRIVAFSTVFGITGALLAYVIAGGGFIGILLAPFLSIPPIAASVVFWGMLSIFVFRGIQMIAKMEFFMNLALGAVITGIAILALPHLDVAILPRADFSLFFLPFGIVLFALSGAAAVPEIADFFKNDKERGSLDNLIIIAGIITASLTAGFGILVAGVSGSATSEEGIAGLIPVLGPAVAFFGAALGLVAIAASFLILGNYLKNSLRYDYRISAGASALIATGLPLLLFLAGIRSFAAVLAVAGAVMGTIDILAIIAVFYRAKRMGARTPEYSLAIPGPALALISLILALGAVAAIGYGI